MMPITTEQFAFLVMAAITLGAALMVVTLRNIFHSLLFLALSFLGVAGVYLVLSADFMAAAQVVIYIGAIIVLMMFALMMTHRVMTTNLSQTLGQWWITSLPISIGILTAFLRIFVFKPWHTMLPADSATAASGAGTTGTIGQTLFTSYVLPFELASILLLVAIVGAIVLAKDERIRRAPETLETPAEGSPPHACAAEDGLEGGRI